MLKFFPQKPSAQPNPPPVQKPVPVPDAAATPAPAPVPAPVSLPPPAAAPTKSPPAAPQRAAIIAEKPKPIEKPILLNIMAENPNKNILSKDVEIKGNIKFTNELIIDGKIEGEISSDGVLTVGENADIRGEIKTKSVTVLGRVQGNITVGERCELKARAHLVGDLKAARLVIEEGATFVGKSEVTSGKLIGTGGSKQSSQPHAEILRVDEASSPKVASFGR